MYCLLIFLASAAVTDAGVKEPNSQELQCVSHMTSAGTALDSIDGLVNMGRFPLPCLFRCELRCEPFHWVFGIS